MLDLLKDVQKIVYHIQSRQLLLVIICQIQYLQLLLVMLIIVTSIIISEQDIQIILMEMFMLLDHTMAMIGMIVTKTTTCGTKEEIVDSNEISKIAS